MARASKNKNFDGDFNQFGRGWSAGYGEYRYGSKKPVTLPKVFEKKERQQVVTSVLDHLRDWRSTPFENEGPLRHGVRAAICLQGHSWPVADAEAAGMIHAAFMKMGVRRPTWDQGQREYIIAVETCSGCGSGLDEAQIDRRHRFCSVMCAKSASQHRDWETTKHESTIGQAAYRMILRSNNPERACEHCGLSFHPTKTGDERYCSVPCADRAKVKVEQKCARQGCKKLFRPSNGNMHYCSARCRTMAGTHVKRISVTCEQCKTPFIASRADARFCGARCKDQYQSDRKAIAAGRQPRRVGDPIVRCCEFCGDVYFSQSPKAGYCATDCRNLAQWFRSGRVPKNMRPQVFDHLFTVPANETFKAARSMLRCEPVEDNVVYLTPRIFDEWFRRAA